MIKYGMTMDTVEEMIEANDWEVIAEEGPDYDGDIIRYIIWQGDHSVAVDFEDGIVAYMAYIED